MAYVISSTDLKKITLNETDRVRSVLQNVSIILRTKKYTVPCYRQFGLTARLVDRPMGVVMPMLFAEIKEAVEEYEPRAEVVNISFGTDFTKPGVLYPVVEVNILDE